MTCIAVAGAAVTFAELTVGEITKVENTVVGHCRATARCSTRFVGLPRRRDKRKASAHQGDPEVDCISTRAVRRRAATKGQGTLEKLFFIQTVGHCALNPAVNPALFRLVHLTMTVDDIVERVSPWRA